jgi:mono/diheme cytochrome c family protein
MPNLEQAGLQTIDYDPVDEMAADEKMRSAGAARSAWCARCHGSRRQAA